MKENILSLLKEIDFLNGTSLNKETSYNGKPYLFIYDAMMNYKEIKFEIKICIPNDWDRKLIDIYIINYIDIPYLPHIENNRENLLISTGRNSY